MTWPLSRLTTYSAGPPGSQVKSADLNAIQDRLIQLSTGTRNRFPRLLVATNWAVDVPGGGPGGAPTLSSSGVGDAVVDLDLEEGRRLKQIKFALYGNASADLTFSIEKHYNDATGAGSGFDILAQQIATNPAAAWSDRTIRLDAHTTSGLTVTVANDGSGFGQYIRSAGSYLSEGFYVGQVVTWAGFSHSGNNGAVTITTLTDTVMDTSNAAYVAEGPSGSMSVAATDAAGATVTDASSFRLRLTASATALHLKSLRDTSDVPL